MDYKHPLGSNDKFFVALNMQRESRIKIAFNQDIYRLPDKKLILRGKTIGTALNQKGRPSIPDEIQKVIERGVRRPT